MSELTNNDYKKILEFYNKPIPKSRRLLKKQAEKILANKLCKCIKKVDKENEARAIGIKELYAENLHVKKNKIFIYIKLEKILQ